MTRTARGIGTARGGKMINATVKAEFIRNAPMDVQKGIAVSEYIRNETLNRAYATSGYTSMPSSERTRIYDAMRGEVIAELAAMGIVV